MFRVCFAVALFFCSSGTFAQEPFNVKNALLRYLVSNDDTEIRSQWSIDKGLFQRKVDGQPTLSIVAAEGSTAQLLNLLKMGADLNATDTKGYTPVMTALSLGQTTNALVLKGRGADLEVIADDGHSAASLADGVGLDGFAPAPRQQNLLPNDVATRLLLFSAEVGDVELIKLAKSSGASPLAETESGWSPVMLAAFGGHREAFDFLFDKSLRPQMRGANKRLQDPDIVLLAIAANNDWSFVEYVAERLADEDIEYFNTRLEEYRTAATNVGYGSKIDQVFPPPRPPIELFPELEYSLPINVPETVDNWKITQQTLADEGLYSGAIDGVPGPKTYRALYSYVAPLAELVRERSAEAASRARYKIRFGSKKKFGYGYKDNYPYSKHYGEHYNDFMVGYYVSYENQSKVEYRYLDRNEPYEELFMVSDYFGEESLLSNLFFPLMDFHVNVAVWEETTFVARLGGPQLSEYENWQEFTLDSVRQKKRFQPMEIQD